MTPELTYLASPYTSDDPVVVLNRVRDVRRMTEHLIAQGEFVFSPICHSCALDALLDRPYEFWTVVNRPWLDRADRLTILTLDGWERSRGVMWELTTMLGMGKPTTYISMESIK